MGKEGKKRKAQQTEESATDLSLSEEDISELAETLNKEQLVGIVKEAALCHTDIRSKLLNAADEDPAGRKLFVRGLSWSTEKDGLKKAFEEFGAVKDALVVTDKSTGKSKGYGFVTFKHRDGALRALKEPTKKIEGRNTVCNLSSARETETAAVAASAPPLLQVSPDTVASSRKVYVGHVPKNMQKSTLKTFFSQYGEIEEGPLGFDKKTGKCKGYSLIVYKSHDSVRKCLQEPSKTIDGHKVQCKLADTQKNKEDKLYPGSSTTGYELTNPGLIAPHNPSFFQSGNQSLGRLPSELSSLHGMDAFMPHTATLLGRQSALAAGSLSSLYGLPLSNSLSSSHQSLAALQDVHGLGLSSLPRSAYY
ncbi:hypothetical protein L7F22_069052 [Adiantum nelumboides]|nr:hypothetical protein [Adiantum nelumboides]